MEPKELDKPDPAVADSAAGQRAQPGQSYAGIVVHHGATPLNNDAANKNVYSVTLQTAAGIQTLWDSGLEQAVSNTQVQPGDALRLDRQGQAWTAQAIDAAALQAYSAEAGQQQPVASVQAAESATHKAAADIDPSAFDALMKVVGEMKTKGASLDPEEVRRINEALHEQGNTNGSPAAPGAQREPNGIESLVKGSAELVSGVASLTGAALQGLGKGAQSLAKAWDTTPKAQGSDASPAQTATAADTGAALSEEMAGRVQVLPRLSEYRVDQVEKAASNYEKAHTAFWNSGGLPQVREQIEARAEQTGLSVPEVIEKMKPDGEYTDLHAEFVGAVGQSPEAQSSKKAMDKALTGWTRQYGRAQEELLNPETEGNPHYDKLKNRLEESSENIHNNAANTPAFEGESHSHLERLKESMQRIFERLKEVLQGIGNMVRNTFSGSSNDNDAAP
ncbi:hypothetical protein F3J44_14990 [Pantoea sp. Tr-811]|uniref:hypothetical protein n=1 Tax=Pantoea sp. Tr-811 TaxID=2608361 RepID=UPI00141F3FD7|nr:hypothetical protein [Pantoea sp. Tr-811]NIF27674.1 hypothetical protein [Pantoea sp. Tr-811]